MKPVIFGCEGARLSDDEKTFFAEVQPAGAILFGRNVHTPDQVARLVDELRSAICAQSDAQDTMILVDQEGGRVQRLGAPHWRRVPPARFFADLEQNEPGKGIKALRLSVKRMGAELRALGINVDCLPVLDVPVPGAHDIIGERAYGDAPEMIASMGRVAADALLSVGVLPVIKHIPGHGRAGVDSHMELPIVDADRETLSETDFAPFAALSDLPLAMTAHVVYSAIDADHPATLSAKVLTEVVRGEIGFGGLLMTDDLSMKALAGSLPERATASLAAGVDLVLHCDGNLADMEAIAAVLPDMSENNEARVRHVLDLVTGTPDADIAALTRDFDSLMEEGE